TARCSSTSPSSSPLPSAPCSLVPTLPRRLPPRAALLARPCLPPLFATAPRVRPSARSFRRLAINAPRSSVRLELSAKASEISTL
ncbi:hypothetical protein FB45DRAFT_1062604, partial [Roridomyces roridus]